MTENTKETVTNIVLRFKGEMTWDEFAAAINRTPGLQKPVSRSQVNNWGVGTGPPSYYFLTHLESHGEGWVKRFAKEMLDK